MHSIRHSSYGQCICTPSNLHARDNQHAHVRTAIIKLSYHNEHGVGITSRKEGDAKIVAGSYPQTDAFVVVILRKQ